MPIPFSLEQLRAFVLVIDTGSFSAAAVQLDVSQPAVSAQVRELERKLGARLIERVGRRATPTSSGTALLGYARELLETASRAAEAVASLSEGVHGCVRLGIGATACLHFLPPVLGRLRQRHPELQVVVLTGNAPEFVRQVEQNVLDFALVTLPAPSRALVAMPILKDQFVVIGPSGSPTMPEALTPALAETLPLILVEPGANTRRLVDAWLTRSGAAVRPVMELGSVETIKEMVRAGMGLGVVPQMAVRAKSGAGLRARPLQPILPRELALILRQDKPLTRGMQVLRDALVRAGRSYDATE